MWNGLQAAITVALIAALGSPLRQDGYSVRPPEAFRLVRMDLFHGTTVGAIALDPERPRYLSAALADSEDPDAAMMIVSVVDESFTASPSTRDAFSAATMRHFADALGTKMSLERTQLVEGPAPRVEVLGTVKQQDQVRTVLVAGMEGEGRHAVILFSVPSGRYQALAPLLRESLDSYRPDTPPRAQLPQSVAGVLAVLLALALFASFSLWRRRRKLRRADLGLPG